MRVLLEGNIAAGKSTLGEALSASPDFCFVPEPVARWQTGFAANLLERFYTDTRRWALTMQIGAFITRIQALDAAPRAHPLAVYERPVFCDRHVFAKNLHAQGLLDDTEWALYLSFWDFLAPSIPQPDALIYLRTPAEECYRRLQARGRAEEQGIVLAYLQQLERRHDEWLLDPAVAGQPVVVLDGARAHTAAEVRQELAALVPVK